MDCVESEKMSKSKSVKANSPEVWGRERHSGDLLCKWRFDDDLKVDWRIRCSKRMLVGSGPLSDRKRTRHPFYSRGNFHQSVARAWNNFPFEITVVQDDRFFFLKLNDEVSFRHLIQLTSTQWLMHSSILSNSLSLSCLSATLRTQDDRVVYMSPVLWFCELEGIYISASLNHEFLPNV